jgi:hypothetical protein
LDKVHKHGSIQSEKYLKYAGTTKIKELKVCRKLLIYITFECKYVRIFNFVDSMQCVPLILNNFSQYYGVQVGK